jgi:hypothetical protein
MDHEFDLAFELLDHAIELLAQQQYGTTTIGHHNHGEDLTLTSRHTYSSTAGHTLTLLATYTDYPTGTAAAVTATAPDLETTPTARIVKVFAADLMFHAIPGTWSFTATGRRQHYTITAGTGDVTLWTLHTAATTTPSDHISELIDHILATEARDHTHPQPNMRALT